MILPQGWAAVENGSRLLIRPGCKGIIAFSEFRELEGV
jgi:hypothetical protein